MAGAGLLIFALCLVVPSGAFAAVGDPERSVGQLFDIELIWLRLAIAGLAALLLAWLLWSSRADRASAFGFGRARGAAVALLGVLALAAFAANYNFFLWPRAHGMHAHEVFHYYVGGKYFPELGYFDLYRCSLAVEGQTKSGTGIAAAAAVKPGTPVRDLRSDRLETAAVLTPSERRCDGLFDAQRWTAFERDVRWFQSRLGARKWKNVLADHGFNPTPVWTLIGRPLAEWVPAKALPMRWAVKLDLLLLVAGFAAVGWAFGFTAMCTAVIAWGTNPLSRYQWVGDAFLRYPWLVAGLLGLCFLRQRRSAVAGGFLTLASLLRVFPLFQLACLAVYAIREGWARRALAPESIRVVTGALVAVVVLLLGGTAVSGRGVAVYQEFTENIVSHSEIFSWSSVGLQPLLAFSPEHGLRKSASDTQASVQRAKRETFESRWMLYGLALAVFGVLLLRVLGRCEAWEAAALGVVPVLLLTNLQSYYVSGIVVLALLATHRPRIGIALMLALVACCASSVVFYQDRLEFVYSSAILLALMLYTLLEMQWPAAERARGERRSP